MKKIVILSGLLLCDIIASSQTVLPANWRAYLIRQDSNLVVFNLKTENENGKTILYVLNAEERIKITAVSVTKDSVNFSMPVFESTFKSKRNSDGSLQGVWIKGTGGVFQYWPFFAFPQQSYRFIKNQGKATTTISGKWDVTITRANGTLRKAVAIFRQQYDKLTGTFLTPSGDYRYLEGVVTRDSLKLSTFDGAHAYTFYAKIDDAKNISGGVFYSGFNGRETWVAVKNEKIPLPSQDAPTRLREGESKLNFSFNDLEGKPVSINDERYRNKVVIIQIMGSWCPNCLDETKFLNEYYTKNKNRGVEVIGLAYEYTTDLERSTKSLQKFQQLFNVQYPMLITGAIAADDSKTEKTLPQLTPIRSFPTTIFIDKKGTVREIKGTFYGPGTGKYFEEFKKGFYSIVDGLLNEK
jgi:thiol-disulfide isomerase/thioredoxin